MLSRASISQKIKVCVFVFFLSGSSIVQSAAVTIGFEGFINQVFRYGVDPFNGQIDTGSFFSGNYTYDTNQINSGDSSYASYVFSSTQYGMDLMIGSYSGVRSTAVVPLNYRIIIPPVYSANVVQDIQSQGLVFGGVYSYIAQIYLEGPAGILGHVNLSLAAPVISDYFTKTFVLSLGPDSSSPLISYFGEITRFALVSEPSSIVCLGLGFFIFLLYRRTSAL